MNPACLRIGVIGAGVFGNYHAAKCQAHPRHDFIGIYDTHPDRVREVARRNRTRAFENCNMLISGVDALIVASPAIHHGAVALAALKAGRHVLVEKPIAARLDIADEMIRLAREQNLVLQVDHQERFIAKAIGLDQVPERPVLIESVRYGPNTGRGLDVSVTLDLMTHDLDMAMWLTGEKPNQVKGESLKVFSDNADVARAILHFPGGAMAKLEAGRVKNGRTRSTRVVYPDGELRIDFVNKKFENTTGFALDPGFADNRSASDSLGASVDAFTSSVLDGTPVAIPASAGRDAVEIALMVDRSGDYQ